MTDGDSAAAAAGDTTGATDAPTEDVINTVPNDWAENDHFKTFYDEDGRFDFERFGSEYADAQGRLSDLSENQPELPATSDDYTFDFGEDPAYPVDEVDVKLQRDLAKDLGLTQAQYEGIVKYDLARMARATEEIETEAQQTREALIKEWGGQQKFEANLQAAAKTAVAIFGAEFAERTDLGNDPQLIKGLYLISQKISEDTLKSGSGAAAEAPVGDDGERRFVYGGS